LIKNHHERYINWEEYKHNQQVIAENANMKGAMARGSVKRGPALLAGLLRCGHCGRKLHVSYSGSNGQVVRYNCRGAQINHGTGSCINIGSLRLERVIIKAMLEVLSPIGIEAAIEATRLMARRSSEARAQKELAIQQARYEADRAYKQYDLADPENRLVTAELERRWNEKLHAVEALEEELKHIPPEKELSPKEKNELLALGTDLPLVWDNSNADPALKKRILRAVLKEIIISIHEDMVTAVLHWEGGDHSQIQFPKNKTGCHRWKTDIETERIVRDLARVAYDHKIASLLNRLGKKTVKGNSWTQMRVASFRNSHDIRVYQEGEVEACGEIFLDQAAEILGVHKARIYKLIRKGRLQARQVCFGAPWLISKEDLEKIEVMLANHNQPDSPLTPMQ